MPQELLFLEIITISIAGLLFGSFAGALVYRIPRDIPFTRDADKKASRSACIKCGYILGFFDLIPVFSWLFLRGRCRSCGTKISCIYPIVEITTLLGFWAVYSFAGFTWIAVPLYLLIACLSALIYIDLEHYILPNELVGAMALLGLFYNAILWFTGTLDPQTLFIEYILGGALLYGAFAWLLGIVMEKILKKEALGFGDVKFFAAAGLWIGLQDLAAFMIGAGVFGIILALIWRMLGKGEVFPFGPALILSFFILLFFDGSHFL